MAALNYPMSKVMKEVTLSVRFTGEKRARLRLWLGVQLMCLAAWVAGCGICIESGEAGDE